MYLELKGRIHTKFTVSEKSEIWGSNRGWGLLFFASGSSRKGNLALWAVITVKTYCCCCVILRCNWSFEGSITLTRDTHWCKAIQQFPGRTHWVSGGSRLVWLFMTKCVSWHVAVDPCFVFVEAEICSVLLFDSLIWSSNFTFNILTVRVFRWIQATGVVLVSTTGSSWNWLHVITLKICVLTKTTKQILQRADVVMSNKLVW